MAGERWFPAKHELHAGFRLGRLLHSGPDWQIYRVNAENSILIVESQLAEQWAESKLLPETVLDSFSFGRHEYRAMLSGSGRRLEPVAVSGTPDTKADGLAFALSLRETRKIDTQAPLHDAIYVERYSRLLPTWTVSEGCSDEEIMGRWLTGGVSIPATSFRRLSNLIGWLDQQDAAELVRAAGFSAPRDSAGAGTKRKAQRAEAQSDDTKAPAATGASQEVPKPSRHHRQFRLSGRPVLEQFFNEHVIDIVENSERYRPLGIEFPAAAVLHGPPGCGKSFAVEQLVEYLDWPIFCIDSNSVGSSYIHGTSKKVGEIFDKAVDAAPSVIVIDEMESYLSDRQIHASTSPHRVEEVTEFLRRIPEANKHRVLVIGMTNRLEMIDSAVLRRGRFDHVVEVGMPSATELSDLIDSLLAKVPVEGEIDASVVVNSLTGRALSDAAFLVREASRMAARAGKSALDDESLRQALASIGPTAPKRRSIGFIRE